VRVAQQHGQIPFVWEAVSRGAAPAGGNAASGTHEAFEFALNGVAEVCDEECVLDVHIDNAAPWHRWEAACRAFVGNIARHGANVHWRRSLCGSDRCGAAGI
jgi:hypothetical protein